MTAAATDALSSLSIVIVTWRGDDLLKDCLDSLAQSCGTLPQIVVVDNAAEDATAAATTAALVKCYPNAAYVPSPGNPGFAGGNNRGLPLATREYVLLLNNDTIVRAEPFTQLIAFLKSHPRVGIVQGTLNLSRCANTLDDCGTLLTPLGVQYHRYFGKPTATTPRETAPVLAAKGALLLFRRAVLNDLGGVLFYDSFKSYYEETDFCHRAWLMGWESWFVDTPPVDHLMGQTSAKLNGASVFAQYLANIWFSYATVLGPWGKVRLYPGFLLLNAFNFLRHLLLGHFAAAGTYFAAIRIIWARRREQAAARKRIQSTRHLNDWTLFKQVLHHPRLSYYWLSSIGKLKDYQP